MKWEELGVWIERVNLEPKDFLLGEITGVMIREYLRRRVLQRVWRVIKRSNGKEDSLPCSPPFASDYLGKSAWSLKTILRVSDVALTIFLLSAPVLLL